MSNSPTRSRPLVFNDDFNPAIFGSTGRVIRTVGIGIGRNRIPFAIARCRHPGLVNPRCRQGTGDTIRPAFRQALVCFFAANSVGMTFNGYPAPLGLIIQHVSNALDSTLSIAGQVRPTEFKQDVRKIDHYTALSLPRLKIAALEFFKQLTVARDLLALPLNLLLVRCEFSIAFLKSITGDRTGDTSQRPTNGSPGPRIPNRSANNRAGGGPETRTPQRSLLSGRQGLRAANHKDQHEHQQRKDGLAHSQHFLRVSTLVVV